MPQRKSGIKALRINRNRRLRNLDIKTDLRKTIKRFLALIKENKGQESESTLRLVYKKLDKAVKRHILEKNTAARQKSRFSKLLQK